ncbi:MAG: OsmC family protein [Chloroflexota bacterium]
MANLKSVHIEARQVTGFKNEAQARGHTLIIDQPAPLSSDGGATPLEFLQMALAGCFISTGYIIARQRGLALRGLAVDISGVLDTEIGLGKSTAGRAGYTGLEVKVHLDADLSPAEKEALVAEIRRRCPVSDNLEQPTPVNFSLA